MTTAEKRYRQSAKGKATIALSAKRYRESVKGKIAQDRYRKSDKAKIPRKAYQKVWRSNHQSRIRIYRKLNGAVKKGIVVRQPCFRCGAPNSHGHHPDYSKALEVQWLCPTHHSFEHPKGVVSNA